MKPVHMVVVSAVFPMRKQYEEFQRQLHYPTMAELLAKPEDTPQALGLTVYRCELKADGTKATEWELVYKYNLAEDKAEAAKRIDKLFREAIVDEDNPKAFGDSVQHGLVTPLPELAKPSRQYPKPRLQDIKFDEEVLPKNKDEGAERPVTRRAPMVPLGNGRNQGVADTAPSYQKVAWSKLTDALQNKFKGKIDFFDFSGALDAKDDALNNANPAPLTKPSHRQRRASGRVVSEINAKNGIADSLVRFVDVGLQPGKTYQYTFLVHMANPNYEKKGQVAYDQLAKEKELLSDFAYSPRVTIPEEYYFYAVDDQISSRLQNGSDWQSAKAEPPTPYGKWNTAVQIHRWLGKVPGHDWTVADWAIAERLLIRRGDAVGRNELIVEVPVWDKDLDTFKIGFEKQNAKRKNQALNHTGVPISFIRDGAWPLLVDFEGGWKSMVKVGGTVIPKDQSAVNLLVLTPEGKLIVRNSREDSDPDNPVAAVRSAPCECLAPGGGSAPQKRQ